MTEVNVHRRGSGPAIVFIHGIGSRWQCFAPVMDLLADRYEVIGIDLPGFGDSPLLPGVDPGVPGYASWLAGWLPTIGVERPHVVGNSMGAAIALELGRSGHAASVTAFAPVGFWTHVGVRWTQLLLGGLRAFSGLARPLVHAGLRVRPVRALLLAALIGRPGRYDGETAVADVDGLIDATGFDRASTNFGPYRWYAGRVAMPTTTVAWGTRDYVLTHRTQSRRARTALPDARHIDLPGCGHLPFADDPAACAAIVVTTVQRSGAGA